MNSLIHLEQVVISYTDTRVLGLLTNVKCKFYLLMYDKLIVWEVMHKLLILEI